ncbi:unnamed protein product [Protopolystoma xenopodis]|uniref:Uncharacterized protein n=1 Tax=Protopolystoma xenopodis TaxID=117903 RepID=A0A3S5BXI7_9PLAT|nr:unnamed protein product [Protopolystoma xenopodis]
MSIFKTLGNACISLVGPQTRYSPSPSDHPIEVFKESFAKFTVDARPVDPQGRGAVKAIVVNPHKQRTACITQNCGDGTWKCSYSPIDEGTLFSSFPKFTSTPSFLAPISPVSHITFQTNSSNSLYLAMG